KQIDVEQFKRLKDFRKSIQQKGLHGSFDTAAVVPTLTFERLFALLVLSHGRRQLLWFEVTRYPTAEWLARQITEAFPWTSAPSYLVRDNDAAYGHLYIPAESHGHP